MVPVQLRYTNVSSWRVASDAQAGGDDAQLVCEHQLCRWQWYCWMFYSAKHLFLSDRFHDGPMADTGVLVLVYRELGQSLPIGEEKRAKGEASRTKNQGSQSFQGVD